MYKTLISGNGKGNSAIFFWWLLEGGLAVICVLLFCFVYPSFYRDMELPAMADFFFYFGIVLVILCIISPLLMHRCIAKTEIYVHENGIEGKRVGKYFIWGDLRVKDFDLAYNQITFVKGTKNKVVIHVGKLQHICYVANPAEIQQVIFSQAQQALGR